MKGVKGSQHHSSESKKAATPHSQREPTPLQNRRRRQHQPTPTPDMKGGKGSQDHFRAEEGSHANIGYCKAGLITDKTPSQLVLHHVGFQGLCPGKKWTQSVSLSSIMSAKTVMESPDFICRRFGDGGRNHLEVAPVHLGFSAPIRSSASKLPPSPSALMASNTFVFGCLL